ncbi:MAG: apolipoprotein N-acyltransferase [Bdellovibrionales bacterium]|nr:apolipoprotein N-acyltransferase [Bdellovibrionales bacterium]
MKYITERPLLLSLIAGVLIGFSYIPGPIFLSWIAFIPLFYLLTSKASLKKIILGTWITQFLLTLIGFHWIGYTISEFGRMPAWIGYAGLVGFCCFANTHFVLAAIIYRKTVTRHTSLSLIWFSLLFVTLEIFYPMIFPWTMGYTWMPSFFPIKQLADTVGVYGLSIITVLINLWLYTLIQAKEKKKLAIIGLGVFVFLNILGFIKEQMWQGSDRTLKALVVQANIGNLLKYKAEKEGKFQTEIINEYISMTMEALKDKKVDLIVWPETAMPIFLNLGRMDSAHTKRIADITRIYNAEIFTGTYSYQGEDIFNSIAYISNQGLVTHLYSKSILLAFGEYFPGTEHSKYFKDLVEKIIPAVSHFARGPGPSVFKTQPNFIVGPQVCYEGLDTFYNQKIVKQGANILINVTNDSWFGSTFEPHQHMHMTLSRAIEYRRPMIRSTNTGISAAITASGKILEESPINEKWTKIYEIPLIVQPGQSIYGLTASLQSYLLLLLTALLGILGRKKEYF